MCINNFHSDGQHMAAYSPISSRSHRNSVHTAASYQIHQATGSASHRRRDSINSSIGATSIRRLLKVNQTGCRYKIPLHIKTKVTRNFILLVLAHGLTCSILVPLFGLQVLHISQFLCANCFMLTKKKCLALGIIVDLVP